MRTMRTILQTMEHICKYWRCDGCRLPKWVRKCLPSNRPSPSTPHNQLFIRSIASCLQ